MVTWAQIAMGREFHFICSYKKIKGSKTISYLCGFQCLSNNKSEVRFKIRACFHYGKNS